MTGFIDIHTHILPGVDDGAQDMESALALVKLAYKFGTRTLLLTPHYRGEYRKNTPQLLRERFIALCGAVEDRFPDMKLYLGQEIYYDAGSVEALAEGRALGIHNTSYAVIEFAPKSTGEQVQKGVEAFLYYGYRPVIAHAERCDAIRKDSCLLGHVLAQGARIQLNADSILGRNGWDVKRFCHKLLRTEEASFVASDAHDRTKRPPLLRECFLYVHKKYGGEYAHRLFYDNPLALIENREV